MLYMVIETFHEGAASGIYQRSRDRGRLLPEGLKYVSRWIDFDFRRCFQLMETEDAALFDLWIREWSDLVDFEVVPFRTSAEAADAVAARQSSPSSPI